MSLRTINLMKRLNHIPGYGGHAHFWERLTRRRFLTTATGAFGLALGSASWLPRLGDAAEEPGALPKPIPGGLFLQEIVCGASPPTELFHVFFIPATQVTTFPDPSTITNFHGLIGAADVVGDVTRLDENGSTRLVFDSDMRFMNGRYIGVDGGEHSGTFGFM